MANDLKWMISSDQQFPYHDPRIIELWFKVMKSFKPDVVDILGDTDDQACYSKYTDGRSAEFINTHKAGDGHEILPIMQFEASGAREFYAENRRVAKKGAELFTALGNHDIRVFNYTDAKLPDYVKEVTPDALWDLDKLGYEYIYYGDMPRHRYGGLHAHHGVGLSTDGSSVKKDVDDFGVSMIRGHSHRLGTYYKTYEMRNETLRGFEIGHMSDLKSTGMSYTNKRNWQHGFAVAHIESGVDYTPDGYYPHIQLVEITPDYTCMIDGKVYKA